MMFIDTFGFDEAAFAKYGREGWEVVAVTRIPEWGSDDWSILMKRPTA
jgi:hypothetical protein